MRLVNILGAESVLHPEHGEAGAGDDGVFELPEPFAEALLAQAPAQWRTEADHIHKVAQKALQELASDPKKAAAVLHYVRGQVTEQAAQIADLTARLAELESAAAAPDPKTAKPAK